VSRRDRIRHGAGVAETELEEGLGESDDRRGARRYEARSRTCDVEALEARSRAICRSKKNGRVPGAHERRAVQRKS
jgi:hypothetical protein